MRRVRFGLWAVFVSWTCSAFLHATDPDVDGLSGLWVPSVLVSVTAVAFVIAIPAVLCGVAFARRSWRGLWVSVTAFSLGMGCVLTLLGAGGRTAGSTFVSLGGSSVLFWLVLLIAVSPAVWIESRERKADAART